MSSPLVTLITPTGSRPLAFSMCESMMARQTYKGPLQWIVVDDSWPPTLTMMGQQYVRGPVDWNPSINTQRPNMEAALQHVKGDIILIIEDDDWYAPNYIETMVKLLDFAPIVGEANARYYNIAHRCYAKMLNYYHASLCQTGIRREILPLLHEAVTSGQLYFDCELWKMVREREIESFLAVDLNMAIGMKGLPGRRGIGVGHSPDGFKHDPDWSVLRSWLPEEDFVIYQELGEIQHEKASVSDLRHN